MLKNEKITNQPSLAQEQPCEALKKAIHIAGGQTALAKKCGITQQSLYLWLKNGIPPRRVLQIEKAVNEKITRYQLRPDLYPKN